MRIFAYLKAQYQKNCRFFIKFSKAFDAQLRVTVCHTAMLWTFSRSYFTHRFRFYQ